MGERVRVRGKKSACHLNFMNSLANRDQVDFPFGCGPRAAM